MRKGIFIAFLISFLLVSSFIPSVSAQGFLSDIFEKIKQWFESSPFGNIFAQPVKRMEEIDLTFYPENFSLSLNTFVNITSNSTKISNFKGDLLVSNGYLELKEFGSSLTLEQRIDDLLEIHGLGITNLELKNMKLHMISGNWNETSENGSVKIFDFLGKGIIRKDMVELIGNVSKVIKG
jgi:hypothetical protein